MNNLIFKAANLILKYAILIIFIMFVFVGRHVYLLEIQESNINSRQVEKYPKIPSVHLKRGYTSRFMVTHDSLGYL